MKTPFHLMAESGLSVLLVGGHALHVYRYTRQTLDFDFMIAVPDYTAIRDYLAAKGYAEQGADGAIRALSARTEC